MTDLKKVNLYKIKPNVPFDTFLKGELTKFDHIQCPNGTYEGYIKYAVGGGSKKDENQIPWLTFLNTAFTDSKYTYKAYNRFPRALLALKIKINNTDHFYVAAFGQHGDAFLEKDYIVRDFGIKVGMNICDIEKLRRVQTTIHESISQQAERQVSTGASLSVFNINNETEFLRTISGYVSDAYKDIIDSFKGKDNIALKFTKDNALTWDKLVEVCKKLEERYQSTDYTNTEFKVYDILRHENDPQVVKKLDEELCDKIKVKDFSKIHLAPPDFLQEDEISYAYKEKQENKDLETHADIFIDDLVNQPRRKLANLTTGTLKSWKIFKYDHEQDKTFPLWNAYQCLVAEIDLEGKTYILSNGYWREVSDELKNRITTYFQNNDLFIQADYLPENINIYDSQKKENREEVYNCNVAENSEKIYLFDKAKLTIGGKKKYEICDLLSDEKHFIHVKRYSSGAASISHLFTQGKFYSHAFSTEEACRADMKEWIDKNELVENEGKNKCTFKNLIPNKNNEVQEDKYHIIFCILHDSNEFNLDNLPLMSQYELMNSHRYLTEDRKFKCGVVFKKIELGVNGTADE